MREGVRSYLHSLYISLKTGNMDGLRPKVLSYHHNTIKMAQGARLIVEDRVHLSTRPNTWPSSCYIEMAANSTLHFTGRASIRGEAHIVLGEGARVVVGNHCILRERLWLAAQQEVTLADGAGTGQDTMILDSDVHPIIIDGKWERPHGAVHIGKNVWVGAHCIILKGVTIGEESIIGAGSLVTKDIPDHVLALGRPAKPYRKVDRGRIMAEELPEVAKSLGLI